MFSLIFILNIILVFYFWLLVNYSNSYIYLLVVIEILWILLLTILSIVVVFKYNTYLILFSIILICISTIEFVLNFSLFIYIYNVT